jgi:hypothetical protein
MGNEYFFVTSGIDFVSTTGVVVASEKTMLCTFEAAVPNVFEVAGLGSSYALLLFS